MPLPNSITTRELISKYLDEAVTYSDDMELAKTRLKSVFDSVKESEEKTEYTLKEFKALLKAELDKNKLEKSVAEQQQALDDLSVLKKA